MVHIPPYFRNPPRYFRSSHTDIININVGSSCGGHVHHCSGGWGMNKGMGAMFGIGLLTSFFSSLFNKGGNTQLYPMNNYNIGYNAGLYTPGSTMGGYNAGFNQGLYGSGTFGTQNNGYNAGFNQGLYGSGNAYNQYSTLQGQYGQQQQTLATKANELVAMVKDLANDYGFTFGENEEIPQMSANGQQYTYKGKSFDTVTDLRNFIEKQEGLGCDPTRPARRELPTVIEEEPIVIDSDDETTDTTDTTDTTPVTTTPTENPEDTTPPTQPARTQPSSPAPKPGTVMTPAQTEKMFAILTQAFGEVPAGVELNPDGTYNYGKYQNIDLDALKYAVNAKKNYDAGTESKKYYDNHLNNYKNRIYADGQMSLKGQQISNTETLGAFLLRNNPDTTIVLSNITTADFEKTFKNMFEDNIKNAKKDISEKEFIKYHKDYEANAKDGTIRRDDNRQKYDTVDMTAADEAQLKNLFKAMSKGQSKLTKEQYVKFMTGLFAQYKGKVTRAQLDDYCVNWLKK